MAKTVSGPLLTGNVTSRQTGAPLAGVTVTVSATVYTDPELSAGGTTSLTTNGAGSFSAYARPGVYTFTCSDPSAAPIEPVEILSSDEGGSGAYPLVTAGTSAAWAPTTVYALNQMVTYQGVAYRCTTAHTSGATFDGTNWEAWAADAAPRPQFLRPIPAAMATTVSTFQSGHGWTATGATSADDTTTFTLGSQSVKLTTNGAGGTGRLEKASLTTFDITKVSIAVLVNVADMTKLNTLKARIGTSAGAGWSVTLYAPGASQQPLVSGQWTWLTYDIANTTTIGTPPAVNAVTYIAALEASDKSTGACVININAVKLIPKPSTLFPNGVVSLGFDDGYIEHYTKARPYLDKYGFAATEYPICDLVASGGAYMSVAQMQEMQNNSGWEIQAHSARSADHTAVGGFTSLTAAQLDAEARDMIAWAVANGFPAPWHHAYPQGLYNATVRSVMAKYFTASRTIDSQPSGNELMPPIRPMEIRCQPLDTRSTATFTGLIDSAYANGDWLVLYTHRVLDTGAVGTQISTANFQTVVDYLNTKAIPVRTVGDVLQSLAAGRP